MNTYDYDFDNGNNSNSNVNNNSNDVNIKNGHNYIDYSQYSDYGNNTPNGDYEDYFARNDKKLEQLDIPYIYPGYDFERVSYLYIWPIIVIVTTILNALVVLVLVHRRMRNATNVILIAMAITDSLSGLVMVPVFLLAYGSTSNGELHFSEKWCETFMLIKYFVARAFHTMSIWLTVLLGAQRLVSVAFPFRASSVFSVHNTCIYIGLVLLLSPVLHVYHTFDVKTTVRGHCQWDLKATGCNGGCIYIWFMMIFMHAVPCLVLVTCTVAMICTMNKATQKMKNSQMISNVEKLHKRALESRRISAIVITVVIVFLIPEVPHMIFLIVFMAKHHAQASIELKINRAVICAYELLVILSFHANFWIYLVMNRKFREGLSRALMDPAYSVLGRFGVTRGSLRRRSSFTSSFTRTNPSEVPHTFATRSRSSSLRRHSVHSAQLERRPSRSSSHSSHRGSVQLELKTYTFKPPDETFT